MRNKVAMILSGCGYKEGTEIHEAVLSYLALDKNGFQTHSFSTDKMLEASAPIARDQISPLSTLQEKDYDILWMPGGFGVAKHLSSYAKEGANCTVDKDVKRVIEEFQRAKKPIVAICFAPVIVAKVLEGKGIEMTLGSKKEDGKLLEELGAHPLFKKVDEFARDANHQIYTTPGYMEPPSISGIYNGIEKIVNALKSCFVKNADC
jgi:enhancing lycopene biosynthesis protein 2